MSRLLVLSNEAEVDLSAIYDYLLEVNERALMKFERNLDSLFDRIVEMPLMYAKVWRTVRAARVRRFRYVVYYIVHRKVIDIVAVIHAARDSSAWKSRL